jgi:hypothetical protein
LLTLERPVAGPAMIRELARNLERAQAGPTDQVCFTSREAQSSCACYRDAHHAGDHRCMCGAEWAAH